MNLLKTSTELTAYIDEATAYLNQWQPDHQTSPSEWVAYQDMSNDITTARHHKAYMDVIIPAWKGGYIPEGTTRAFNNIVHNFLQTAKRSR